MCVSCVWLGRPKPTPAALWRKTHPHNASTYSTYTIHTHTPKKNKGYGHVVVDPLVRLAYDARTDLDLGARDDLYVCYCVFICVYVCECVCTDLDSDFSGARDDLYVCGCMPLCVCACAAPLTTSSLPQHTPRQ